MFRFLLKNRVRPGVGSSLWFKTWAKRVLTAPQLFEAAIHCFSLRLAGAQLADNCVFSVTRVHGKAANLAVGEFSAIGRAVLHCHGQIRIGDNVTINDGVYLLSGTHDIDDPYYAHVFKSIEIADYAWIATAAIVLPGVKIGRGAVVAAGAVVSRDVAPYTTVAGNPARLIGTRKQQDFRYRSSQFYAFFNAWLGPESASPPQDSGDGRPRPGLDSGSFP